MTFTRNDADTFSLPTATIDRYVEWVDTDAAGHQHNSAILRWVETCEAELFRNLGLVDYFASAPRVHQVVNYTAKLFFGQRVTTSIVVQKVGRTSLTLGFEVFGEPFQGRSRVSAAHGHVVVVHMTPGADQTSAWPQATLSAIHKDESNPAAHR